MRVGKELEKYNTIFYFFCVQGLIVLQIYLTV